MKKINAIKINIHKLVYICFRYTYIDGASNRPKPPQITGDIPIKDLDQN